MLEGDRKKDKPFFKFKNMTFAKLLYDGGLTDKKKQKFAPNYEAVELVSWGTSGGVTDSHEVMILKKLK